MQQPNLLSKFRGSVLGGLVGDCCGEPYEGQVLTDGDKAILRRSLNQLEGPYFKAPAKKYTDDSAMTRSVIRCLIEHKDINTKELATSFVKEHAAEPNRGYGGAVVEVFRKLLKNKFTDIVGPAQEQFLGRGSYGNGAAMRVSPIGLFCYNKPEKLVELVKKSAEITHSHSLGINGAVLQAAAVNICVQKDPKTFFHDEFLSELIPKMQELEKESEVPGIKASGPNFTQQLKEVKTLLDSPNPLSEDEVLNALGHDVTAIYSVPTAIFIFLRAQGPIEGIQSENPFRRTLEYAISLGGDTDTIASMACSLTGALHGDSLIPENLLKHCEAHGEFIELANKLYESSI
ncbi:unnamed protein product [Hermetia illucens]|uniref:ADP-ribosylhydrolase ARH3 n=2 Tax=Hermetia illucens TaxID=343691 RepID=A0A7R8Z0Z5_HERIL|nr:ADP-ribose glycohydrolase ARH3-like isoform X2 [Hermetia illucens]CAD7093144.1 unnamed protein product [Hermetia illucens]